MEAKEEIKKLSDDLGIIGVYDYEKHKEWEWKQKAKEYVKDDLALIDSLREENDMVMKQIEEGKKALEEDKKSLEEGKKSLKEGQKSLKEGQKSLEEGQKSLDERNRAFEEDRKSFEEQILVTAQKLLNKDFSIEEVKDITGLSLEVLHSLK